MQGEFFGKKMSSTEKMRKSGNNELKRRISKDSSVAIEAPRTLNEHRKIEPSARRLRYDPRCHFPRSENIAPSESSKVRRAGDVENVTSASQRVTRHQNAARTTGARP